MAAPAYQTPRPFSDLGFDGHEELSPGERIGPPLRRSRGRAMVWGIILLMALGGGWALLGDRASWQSFTWPRWLAAETAAVSPRLDRKLPETVERAVPAALAPLDDAVPPAKTAALEKTAPAAQLAPASKVAAVPTLPANPAMPPPATAAPPHEAASVALPGPPLPPSAADPADPDQMRAEAVGLHPGLSRALLARLSPADYQNAGVAIQTAVAETPDSAVFVWPRQRKPELALFQVRFVPGAAPDCRRYVVTITKDRWVTTALPMERCGSQRPARRRADSASPK